MNDQRKIKIIQIITALPVGGAERILYDLIRCSNREIFDHQVVCVVSGGDMLSDFEKIGIKVTVIGKKTKLGFLTIYRIYKLLKKEKPDIVHAHLFGGEVWGKIAAIMARVPKIISTEHNINLDESYLKHRVKQFLGYFTDAVIAITNHVKEYSINDVGIAKEKLTVIYNGVDPEKFLNPNPKFFQNDKTIFISVARLVPQKGHQYLIEAFEQTKEKNWELWLVGYGQLEDYLKAQTKKLGLQKQIKFLGSRTDIKELLSKADVFVLASIFEGQGIVLGEAAMQAKPIIASKLPAIEELFTDRKTALLVEPKDINGLKTAVEWMMNHKKEAKEMGLLAQKEVTPKINVHEMTKQYESLYIELLKK